MYNGHLERVFASESLNEALAALLKEIGTRGKKMVERLLTGRARFGHIFVIGSLASIRVGQKAVRHVRASG